MLYRKAGFFLKVNSHLTLKQFVFYFQGMAGPFGIWLPESSDSYWSQNSTGMNYFVLTSINKFLFANTSFT